VIVIVLGMSYWTVYFQQFSLVLFMKSSVLFIYVTHSSANSGLMGTWMLPHNMVTVAYDL
jgi:hypothetical protein